MNANFSVFSRHCPETGRETTLSPERHWCLVSRDLLSHWGPYEDTEEGRYRALRRLTEPECWAQYAAPCWYCREAAPAYYIDMRQRMDIVEFVPRVQFSQPLPGSIHPDQHPASQPEDVTAMLALLNVLRAALVNCKWRAS